MTCINLVGFPGREFIQHQHSHLEPMDLRASAGQGVESSPLARWNASEILGGLGKLRPILTCMERPDSFSITQWDHGLHISAFKCGVLAAELDHERIALQNRLWSGKVTKSTMFQPPRTSSSSVMVT